MLWGCLVPMYSTIITSYYFIHQFRCTIFQVTSEVPALSLTTLVKNSVSGGWTERRTEVQWADGLAQMARIMNKLIRLVLWCSSNAIVCVARLHAQIYTLQKDISSSAWWDSSLPHSCSSVRLCVVQTRPCIRYLRPQKHWGPCALASCASWVPRRSWSICRSVGSGRDLAHPCWLRAARWKEWHYRYTS